MEKKDKKRQTPITFTLRHREMVEEIKKQKGYITSSSVVQQALVEMHERIFGNKI